MNTEVSLTDGFMNLAAQLGTRRDKSTHATYAEPASLIGLQREFNTAYRVSWLARKIIRILPEDSTGSWRTWQADNPDIEKIEAEERRLNLQQKMLEVQVAERLYGGAVIYAGVAGDDPSKPFNLSRAKKGCLSHLTVLNRTQLMPYQLDEDILSPTFMEPLTFNIMVGSRLIEVHRDRLSLFRGEAMAPEHAMVGDYALGNFWGDSVLMRVLPVVKRFDSLMANTGSLVYEANVDVLKLPRLMEMMRQPNGEQAVLTYLQTLAAIKGNNGMLVLDAGDTSQAGGAGGAEYDRKAISFAGLADLIDRGMQEAAAAAECPATRLWAQSPAGQNATGESDAQNHAQNVNNHQKNKITPNTAKLTELLIVSALGSLPSAVTFEWNSIHEPSEIERVEHAKKITEVIKELKEVELVNPEVLRDTAINALVETGALPGLEAAVDEYGAEIEDDDTDGEEDPPPADGLPPAAPTPPPAGGGQPPSGQVPTADEQPRAPRGSPNGGQWVGKAGFKQNPIPLSSYTQDKGNFEWALRDIERQIAESDDHEEFVKAVSPGALTTAQDYVAESGRGDAQGGVFPDLGDDYGDDYPVVAVIKETGEHLLIDGNHRMARALTEYPNDKVYAWVFEVSLPKNRIADEQPRAPKGTANGGQWVKAGGGGGASTGEPSGAAVMNALKAASSKKYGPSEIAELTQKDPKALSHYEKKVLSKYKKALSAEVSKAKAAPAKAAEAPKAAAPKDPAAAWAELQAKSGAHSTPAAKAWAELSAQGASGKAETPAPAPKAEAPKPEAPAPASGPSKAMVAAEKVASKSYPADKVMALTEKHPKDLSHYEKKVLAKYKKALTEEVAAGKPAAAAKAAPAPKAPPPVGTKPLDSAAEAIMAKAGKEHGYGMNAETVSKVMSGEWKPKGHYQTQAANAAAEELYAAGYKLPPAALKIAQASAFDGVTGTAENLFSGPQKIPFTKAEIAAFNKTHGIADSTLPQTTLTGTPSSLLSETEKIHVNAYTGSAYHALNAKLRAGSNLSADQKAMRTAIDSATAKYSLAKDTSFVRGIDGDAVRTILSKAGGSLSIGDAFTDDGYSSMTRKLDTANSFAGSGGYRIVIKAKKGHKVMPVKSLSKFSTEDEFLPPRGSKFRVVSFDRVARTIVTELE